MREHLRPIELARRCALIPREVCAHTAGTPYSKGAISPTWTKPPGNNMPYEVEIPATKDAPASSYNLDVETLKDAAAESRDLLRTARVMARARGQEESAHAIVKLDGIEVLRVRPK